MVVSDNRDNGIWEFDGRKNVSADAGMELHFIELASRQATRFIEDVLGYGDFAHVMEECGCLKCLQLDGIINAQLSSQTQSKTLNPADMAVCYLVFGVDRGCQGLYRRKIKTIHLVHMQHCIFEATQRGLGCQVRNDEERHDDAQRHEIDRAGVGNQKRGD